MFHRRLREQRLLVLSHGSGSEGRIAECHRAVTRLGTAGEPVSFAGSVAAPDRDTGSEPFADAGYADAFRPDTAGDIARFAGADAIVRAELTRAPRLG